MVLGWAKIDSLDIQIGYNMINILAHIGSQVEMIRAIFESGPARFQKGGTSMKRRKTSFLVFALLALAFTVSSCSGEETRCDVVTLNGTQLTLVGPELKAGEPAPGFSLVDFRSMPVTMKDFSGKTQIISVLPSVDTPT